MAAVMKEGSPEPPDAKPGDLRHVLSSRYYNRIAGLLLAFLMIASVLYQNHAPLWMWIGPALHCGLLPHMGWWLMRRAREDRAPIPGSMLASCFFGGAWIPLMAFNLLPTVLTLIVQSLQCLAWGGRRMVAYGLVFNAVGVGLGMLVFGVTWQPASSPLTVLACVPLLLFQLVVVNLAARRSISSLQQKQQELEFQNRHDGLSGLFNRTHWEHLVRGEFARFRRSQEPAVLVLADLDHFKRVNDLHGHAAGDEVIRRFAALFRRVLREIDVCGRYGGEEFGILLPLTTAAAAREVIERLRSDLHEHPLLEGVVVTASFGVAELTPHVDSVEAWLRLADQMLYRAKHLGRDQVVVLGEEVVSQYDTQPAESALPSFRSVAARGDQVVLSQLLSGLDMGDVPLALFDPSDHLVVGNPAFMKLFAVPPDAVSYGDIIRHCHAYRVGMHIVSDDIEAWLRAADGKRRSQPRRSVLMDTCDGRWMYAFENSYSDGWVLMQLFDVTDTLQL